MDTSICPQSKLRTSVGRYGNLYQIRFISSKVSFVFVLLVVIARYIWKAFIQLNLGLEQEAMTNLSKGNVKATRSDFYFVKGLMSLKEEKWIEALECFENVFKFHEQRYRPLPLRVLEDTEKHIATLNNMLHNAGSSS